MVNPRSVRSAAVFGLMAGLATVAVAEAVRPRGGTGLLLDWGEVRNRARSWLSNGSTSSAALGAATREYRLMAAKPDRPLLQLVARLRRGAAGPEVAARHRT